jgi:hypothetical protein
MPSHRENDLNPNKLSTCNFKYEQNYRKYLVTSYIKFCSHDNFIVRFNSFFSIIANNKRSFMQVCRKQLINDTGMMGSGITLQYIFCVVQLKKASA